MKRTHSPDDGLSIVEVLIGMFLLAVIAIALIPALWQGIVLSSQQATVATATRQLNALVEQARDGATCTALTAVAANQTFEDGGGREFTTSGTAGACITCPAAPGTVISLELEAVQGTRELASVSALVFVAGAKAALSCA